MALPVLVFLVLTLVLPDLPTDGSGPLPDALSAASVFRETRSLTPAPGLIPYELNVPFWSDGAAKSRWVVLPTGRDGPVARIRFSPQGDWAFPAGTVFVKHFELAVDESRPGERRRLETRLLVVEGSGDVRGGSYRWRLDGSDADLVREPRSEPIDIKTASGMRRQVWSYPGVDDCRKCHAKGSGGVLGPKTRQLNREVLGPSGVPVDQLKAWNRLGLFDPPIDEAAFPRLARADDPGRSLEDRARSYLDANCSHCHRPGGVVADFDARYDAPLPTQGLINQPARINLGIDGARVVAPNDPWRSVLLGRLATLEPTKMPPLAHEVVDREGVALLRAWVESLPGPPVVAPPTIRPASGDYRGPIRVTLEHPDPEAVVRYTLDGSAPGKTSPTYERPIEIRESTTVRARAYKPGATRSITAQETLIIGD